MSDEKIRIYQPKIEPGYPDPLSGDMRHICINKEWLPLLQGFLHPLRWKSAIWEGTAQEVNLMHAYVEDLLLAFGGATENLCDDDSPQNLFPLCRHLRADSPRIEYKPTNPFTQPDVVPEGYLDVPWLIGRYDNFPDEWIPVEYPFSSSTQEGDVFLNHQAFIPSPEDILSGDFLNLLNITESGLPRFTIEFDNTAELIFCFVGHPFGGQAVISVMDRVGAFDWVPSGIPQFVNLQTFNAASIANMFTVLTGILGFAVGSFHKEVLAYTKVEGEGHHRVTVTFIPKLGLLSSGFGGGLRWVKLCEVVEPMKVEDIRFNGCNLEVMRDGAWASLGNLFTGLTLTANDLPPGEQPTIALEDCELVFGIPSGQQGETGLPGADGQDGAPGADGQDGAPGQGIEDVIVNTLPAGSNATETFVDGVLTLGIPRGAKGDEGDCECNPTVEPPANSTDENTCGGANGVTDWILAVFSDFIQDSANKFDTAITGAQLASVFFGPVDDLFSFDAVLNFANGLVGTTSSVILANVSDPDFKETVACALYCLVRLADPKEITPAIVDQWIDGIPSNAGGLAFKAYIHGTLGGGNYENARQKIINRFNIYSREPSSLCEALCTDCNTYDWEHTFDFLAADSGFVPSYSLSGFWINGVGWSGGTSEADYDWVDGGQVTHYARGIEIAKTFDATTITYIKFTGNISAGNRRQTYMAVGSQYQPTEDINADGDFMREWSGEENITSIALATWTFDSTVQNSDPRGYSKVVQCIVRGKGTNPFI